MKVGGPRNVQLYVRVLPSQRDEMKAEAERRGCPVSDVVFTAIKAHLAGGARELAEAQAALAPTVRRTASEAAILEAIAADQKLTGTILRLAVAGAGSAAVRTALDGLSRVLAPPPTVRKRRAKGSA